MLLFSLLLFVRHKSWYSIVRLGRCSLFPSRAGLRTYQHPGIYFASHQQMSPFFSDASRWLFLILRRAFYSEIYENYFRPLTVNCHDALSGVGRVTESFLNIVSSA